MGYIVAFMTLDLGGWSLLSACMHGRSLHSVQLCLVVRFMPWFCRLVRNVKYWLRFRLYSRGEILTRLWETEPQISSRLYKRNLNQHFIFRTSERRTCGLGTALLSWSLFCVLIQLAGGQRMRIWFARTRSRTGKAQRNKSYGAQIQKWWLHPASVSI